MLLKGLKGDMDIKLWVVVIVCWVGGGGDPGGGWIW